MTSFNSTPSVYTVAPMIVTSFASTTVITPEPLSLTCSFEGFPLETVSWMRKGFNIFNNTSVNGRTVSITNFYESNIITSNFTLPSSILSDTGSYTCAASNKFNSVSSSASISAYGKILHYI